MKIFYRCPDCKHTFEKPLGIYFYESVICPGCGITRDALFYIKLKGTTTEDANR